MEDKEAIDELGYIVIKQMNSLVKYCSMFPEEKEGIDAEHQLIIMEDLIRWLRNKRQTIVKS